MAKAQGDVNLEVSIQLLLIIILWLPQRLGRQTYLDVQLICTDRKKLTWKTSTLIVNGIGNIFWWDTRYRKRTSLICQLTSFMSLCVQCLQVEFIFSLCFCGHPRASTCYILFCSGLFSQLISISVMIYTIKSTRHYCFSLFSKEIRDNFFSHIKRTFWKNYEQLETVISGLCWMWFLCSREG